MANATRWVGLDVHASQTSCAVFDSETGEVITRRIVGRPPDVMAFLMFAGADTAAPTGAAHDARLLGPVSAAELLGDMLALREGRGNGRVRAVDVES